MSARVTAAAVLVLPALLAACEGGGASAAAWPPGTVLAVDGEPILGEDVDRVARVLGPIGLPVTRPQLLRDALALVVFPRAVARRAAGPRWEAALEEARRWREELVGNDPLEGPTAGPLEQEVSGSWAEVGPVVGPAALGLEPGVWSEPLDAAGAWVLFRVHERVEGAKPLETRLTVGVVAFPYLPPFTEDGEAVTVERLLDRAELEIVDPAWEEIVPEAWQHRMSGRR